MDTATPTIRALEIRSPACAGMLHRIMELHDLDPYQHPRRYYPIGPLNLELCSSCEQGSHQLCTRRLNGGGWQSPYPCRCLCRFARATDAELTAVEAVQS